MTREEAIRQLDGADIAVLNRDFFKFNQAIIMAISALRQEDHFREVTKKVEPLTLEELRKMDGEPVWWWNKSAKPVCTICVWDRFMDEPMFANYDWQSEYTLKLSKYKWLKKCGYKPYRQKPEEDENGV